MTHLRSNLNKSGNGYFIYIMTNVSNKVLYTGMTNNLLRRVWQHKSKLLEGFTKKYNVTKLVYHEEVDSRIQARKREEQIKAGSRKKKIALIEKFNPEWKDLFNLEQIYK